MALDTGTVYFALDGADFDPDDVTEFLGLKPTSITRKGSRIPGRIPKMNSWRLSTAEVEDCVDVFSMANEIIDALRPKKTRIIEAIEYFKVLPRLEVVLYISIDEECSTPAIGFEVEAVRFLGEIGAFIDIDTYKH